MNRIQRCLAVLAGLGGTLIALAAAATAAFASVPAPGRIHQPVHQPTVLVPVRAAVSGGMPGWQITLIAATAALLAAALAVLLGRALAARRHATTSAT
jgi:hypothetical protein